MLTQGNVIILAGRTGRDPEIRYFESGTCVATLSLAVNRRIKDAPPDWFELVAWGKTAEVLANHCPKGTQIAVVGQLDMEAWVDKNTGQERAKPIVRVDQVELLGRPSGGGSGNDGSAYSEF
jgi:single-strand DNA-binding protein